MAEGLPKQYPGDLVHQEQIQKLRPIVPADDVDYFLTLSVRCQEKLLQLLEQKVKTLGRNVANFV